MVATPTLSVEQEQATRDFLEVASRLCRHRREPVSWATAIKFLSARKFDVGRAILLYEAHENIRQTEGLSLFYPLQDPLHRELITGKFTVLPTRDNCGAAIAVFTARLHNPLESTHQSTLQGLVYQLDVALECIETQRRGLVFIYDMTESKYSHFDYELSQKILTLLKGGYPARLKKVLIVTAPLWFRAPFRILRLFVREKLRDRVYTVSLPQLPLHIPQHSLPRHLGGEFEVDHNAWLQHCFKSMTNRQGDEPLTPAPCDEANDSGVLLGGECISGEGGATTPEEGSVQLIQDVTGEELELSKHHNDSCWNKTSNASSPVPAGSSSASSGFSDDDSMHGPDDGRGADLEQFVSVVRTKARAGLRQEYTEIRTKPPDGTFNQARLQSNLPKNRYTDVLCYDHSRVLLSKSDQNDPSSDYINANFVDGYKQKNAFICTQGPLPKTYPDFWRMIWEQHVLVIVMTTRVVERGRTKCGQYWPLESGEIANHGDFLITTQIVEKQEDYILTKILVTNNTTEEVRNAHHLQFLAWPDYGVPHTATAMLSFLALVREHQQQLLGSLGDTWAGHRRGPPIVVHCSAGIGRTGTFCTLDICISRLEEAGSVDVQGTVEKIRSQRAYSIQMPDQYVFCHLALIEYALNRGLVSDVDLSDFQIPPDSDSD